MSQHYSQPDREDDPHALPDLEVFYISPDEARLNALDKRDDLPESEEYLSEPGWYYWYCFPGCLPDSDAFGPYDSRQEAYKAAMQDSRECWL